MAAERVTALGYEFANIDDAVLAQAEVKKIDYLKSHLDQGDAEMPEGRFGHHSLSSVLKLLGASVMVYTRSLLAMTNAAELFGLSSTGL